MPNFWDAPDIIPLPSLQAYSSLSFVFFAYSLYYAFQVTSKPNWTLLTDPAYLHSLHVASNATIGVGVVLNNLENGSSPTSTRTTLTGQTNFYQNNLFTDFFNRHNSTFPFNDVLENNPYLGRMVDIACIMFHQPLCVWTLINMGYCLLILLGKVIQKLIFGDLRASEHQLIRDSLWNFLFDKFIFVVSVINVQYLDELILWCGWFSVLGFMFLLTHLCKERFNYLAFSPSVSKWVHFRLLTLLSIILVVSIPLFVIGAVVTYHHNLSIGIFLLSECILLFLRTLYCVFLYFIHLWDINSETLWERRASFAYYVELVFDLMILVIDFLHHFHMLVWGNILFSLSSLVIFFQVRSIYTCIKKRIKKHRNYLQVLNLMETNFPKATQEELDNNNDDCAICWDTMSTAQKLPCGHLFHTTCLRSWLEQDTSCPTCRLSLKYRDPNAPEASEGAANNNVNEDNLQHGLLGVGNVNLRFNNHFFHFDGPRYMRWLPRVSVEVTSPNMIDININTAQLGEELNPEELEDMGQQVLEFFPQLSLSDVLDDLRLTGSVEVTIENILEGRILPSTSNTSQTNNQSLGASELSTEIQSESTNTAATSSSNSSTPTTSRNVNFDFAKTEQQQQQQQQPLLLASSESMASTSTVSSPVIDSTIIENEEEEEEAGPDFEGNDLENRFLQLSPNERLKLRLKRKDDMLKKAKNKFQKQDD